MSILVVQMGHSGRLTGATGAPGERDFTEAVGRACARLLNRDGWTVRLVGADPPTASYRGDAFVAVHADGNDNPAVRGASVGHQTSQGSWVAHGWRDAYVRRGYDGPWHPDNYTANLGGYYGVRAAVQQGNVHACIVECGTITNPADHALMVCDEGYDRVALAIGDALGIHQPTPPAPAPAPIHEVIRDMRDGDFFFAKGDASAVTHAVQLRFNEDPPLRRRPSTLAELKIATHVEGHDPVVTLTQAEFDAIPLVS